jgi:hypothetical protein
MIDPKWGNVFDRYVASQYRTVSSLRPFAAGMRHSFFMVPGADGEPHKKHAEDMTLQELFAAAQYPTNKDRSPAPRMIAEYMIYKGATERTTLGEVLDRRERR